MTICVSVARIVTYVIDDTAKRVREGHSAHAGEKSGYLLKHSYNKGYIHFISNDTHSVRKEGIFLNKI